MDGHPSSNRSNSSTVTAFTLGYSLIRQPVGESGLAYYIYENWQAGPHKAVIHHGSCAHCNEGQGKSGKGDYDRSHGKWHGEFKTLDAAKAYQKNMSIEVRKECGHCMKAVS